MHLKSLLAGVMAVMLCTQLGCGAKAAETEGTIEKEESTVAVSDDNTEAVDDVIIDGSAVAVSDVSTVVVEDEKKKIILPEDQELLFDYTNVEGIELEPGGTIAVVVKNTNNAFYKEVREGAQRAIDELNESAGFTGKDKISLLFIGADEATDLDDQINTIDQVLQENPLALCLAAIDMKSCTAQLQTASDSAIPVIILDSGVQSKNVRSVCETDNHEVGKIAAEKMCEKIGESGKVVLVSHLTISETANDRIEGFIETMEEKKPDVEVIEVAPEDADDSLETLLQEVFEENDDIVGIFGVSIDYSKKANSYLHKNDIEDVALVNVDCDKDILKGIADGEYLGAVCQNPYSMGYVAVSAALRAAAGGKIDNRIDTGYLWVDAENAEDEIVHAYMIEN